MVKMIPLLLCCSVLEVKGAKPTVKDVQTSSFESVTLFLMLVKLSLSRQNVISKIPMLLVKMGLWFDVEFWSCLMCDGVT